MRPIRRTRYFSLSTVLLLVALVVASALYVLSLRTTEWLEAIFAGEGGVYFREMLPPEPPKKPVISAVDSADLKQSLVVPTLDSPIAAGNNVAWCASMPALWRFLESDINGGPLQFVDVPEMAARLSAAPDPRPDIPADSLYLAAGFVHTGIVDRIKSELAALFPDVQPPQFPGVRDDDFLAYSYLNAKSMFAQPFTQDPGPLLFTSANGSETEVSAFGIMDDNEQRAKMNEQVRVLYCQLGTEGAVTDCVIELQSEPDPLILAFVQPGQTLAEIVDTVRAKIALNQEGPLVRPFDGKDTLRIPDVAFNIRKEYTELHGATLATGPLEGHFISRATQSVRFNLSRSGAELESEGLLMIFLLGVELDPPPPRKIIFDRPFLVMMQRRDADTPYFVLYVDNAELLKKWDGVAE